MVSRRGLFGIIAPILAPGCTADPASLDPSHSDQDTVDSDGDGVPDRNDDFPEDSRYTYLVNSTSEEIRLGPGEFKLYRFSVGAVSDLRYGVHTSSQSSFDVFVTDKPNFQKFENGSKWSYYEAASKLNTTSAQVTFTVGTDRTYYLVIDNTAEGNATPSSAGDKSVTVTTEVELRRRS